MNVVGVVSLLSYDNMSEMYISIEEQKEGIKQFCTNSKEKLKKIIVIDGTKDSLIVLLNDLDREKDIKGVVIYNRYLLKGYVNAIFWLEKELFKRNMFLFVVKEIPDISPKLLSKAREFLVTLSEYDIFYENNKNKRKKQKKKFVFKGKLPYGYKFNEKHAITINKQKARIVKDIFEQYKRLKSLSLLKKYVDEQKYKTDRGKSFSRQSLWVILTNRAYIGEYMLKDYGYIMGRKKTVINISVLKKVFPPIVNKNMFNEVSQILKGHKK